jgi:hypothetical protein
VVQFTPDRNSVLNAQSESRQTLSDRYEITFPIAARAQAKTPLPKTPGTR